MRLRAPLLAKLLVALVLPVVALFALFATVAYEVSRRDLDAELGRRLEAIAASAAVQVRDGSYLAALAPGDEAQPLYATSKARLAALAKATGARLFIIDPGFGERVDTASDAAIGAHDYRAELDRSELVRVFERGEASAAVTFQGNDGAWYKTGYAPIRASATEAAIVLALGAQAPASYFDRLVELRSRMIRWGGGLLAVTVLAAAFATFLITRNVRRLASAAERIGAGDLRAPITAASRDELGVLAQTMERMRQQLAERDAKMQQMLAGIAHEVRNPLAGMTLFAGILRDELPDGDERRSHVERIQRELGYLERVVNDFLEFARRPKPELADVAIAELLADVAPLASTDAIAVAVDPGDVATVRADRAQLRRAVLNLARNAVQAAAAAEHRGDDVVRISARTDGSRTAIAVWNRGAEIPADRADKLFEPFFTTREKGTGLGLSFVRDIAVDHGGSVEVKSTGGETTFTIVLPS